MTDVVDVDRTPEGDLDPDRIASEIEQWGVRWAQARHAASLLQKTAKAVFAQLVADRMAEIGTRRRDAIEAAQISETWQDHVYAQADAELAANIARVRYDAARARFEALRTAEATRREEMRTLGRR